MEWLNIHLPVLRSPEYIGAEPASRAAWINVLAYCCQQENGGTITGAEAWADRQWQQCCGVTLEEVRWAAPLITFAGNDALVWNYPIDKEREVKAKREAGSRGGLAKAKHSQKQNPSTATSTPRSTTTSSAHTEGEGKEKGNRKEKGKKKENEAVNLSCGTLEELVGYCRSKGLPESDGHYFFNKWEESGWENSGKPIKNWKLTINTWFSAGWCPSQKGQKGVTVTQEPIPTDEQVEAFKAANDAQRRQEQAEMRALLLEPVE